MWRREKTVTAEGIAWGTPEFVSTSCWEGRTPALPKAQVTETVRTETASRACPAGYMGTASLTRTVTTRSTRWPWDTAPVVQDIPGNWIADETGCSRVVVPGGGTPGGGQPGAGAGAPGAGTGPSGGQCGDAGDSGGPGEGTCGTPSVGPGAGSGGSGGGCFLTEAVVRRSAEADDGPTLTVLRAFRDGYMQARPERRALVARYYEIAPRIVAAIPDGHTDWAWIGSRVDEAVAAIGAGTDDRAFAIYVGMVQSLEERWLAPAAGAAS